MSRTFELKPQVNWLYSLWKFSRPHTIIGTTLSVIGVYLISGKIANIAEDLNASNFSNLIWLILPALGAWIACICGNIYIVGLNQIEDVEIDKINKPHLPIAAGEFSLLTGKIIVAIAGIAALLLAGLQGIYLFAMVAISLTIGTIYSLPPIRLKRFPFWAAICIFSVRGAVVNLGLFLHFAWVFHISLQIPAVIWTLTWFVLVFTIAIAIFKDIPDLEGDRQYNIYTFTVKLGQKRVFNLALAVMTICYSVMIGVGFLNIPLVNPIFLISTHTFLLVLMGWRSRQVNLEKKEQIVSFYQFIWKLFFLEYLLFPAACLIAST